jgi:hypothetical protein
VSLERKGKSGRKERNNKIAKSIPKFHPIQTVINPIEVVKIRLQIQGELIANAPKKYRGFLHGIYTIGSEEGIAGLYKGYPFFLPKIPSLSYSTAWISFNILQSLMT